MAGHVAIFRSFRLVLSASGQGGGNHRDHYDETHEYAYGPIEPRLTVADDRILDFWQGSGAVPFLIAELPEGYKWSGALRGVYHKETGEALPADRLAARTGVVPEDRWRSARDRSQLRTGT